MDVTSRDNMNNPPLLYDTSASTTESWSTGSAGRRTPQSSSLYILPPTKKSQPSPRSATPSSTPASRQPSASPRLSPVDWPDDFQPGDYDNRRAHSEPGASNNNNNGALYSSFLNRRYNQSVQAQQRREYANSETGIPERIRRYNQQYPDPEPVVASSSGEEEERQAASPLQPAEERVVNRPLPTYSSPKSAYNKNRGVVKQQKTIRFEAQPSPKTQSSPRVQPSPRSQPSPRAQSSLRSQPSPRVHPSPRAQPSPRSQPSPRAQPSPRVQPSPRAHPVQSSPSVSEPPHNPIEQYPDPTDSQLSIETPPLTSVKDLKRQLWSDDEVLQVAVPPTVTSPEEQRNDRRRSHEPNVDRQGRRGSQRSSRSLSPGQRSSGSDGKFKSKFYEAALAARMRGKLHPSQIDPQDVPKEVQQPNRTKYLNPDEFAYTMSSSFSDPFDEKSGASVYSAQRSLGGRSNQQNEHNRLHSRSSMERDRAAAGASQELTRAHSWAERARPEKQPELEQPYSIAERVLSFDGQISSRGRIDSTDSRSQQQQWRGRAADPQRSSGTRSRDGSRGPRDRSLSRERNVDSIPAPRGRALSSDRSNRSSSREPRRRNGSQGPNGRSRSPFVEERLRRFSSDNSQGTSGRSTSQYMDQRLNDYSPQDRQSSRTTPQMQEKSAASRSVSASSIEELARGYAGNMPSEKAEEQVVTHEVRAAHSSPMEEIVEDPALQNFAKEEQPPMERRNSAGYRAEPPALPPRPTMSSSSSRHSGHTRSASSGDSGRQDQGPPGPRYTESDVSDGQENRDIADLVAKLTAINRENPAEALAQIDSILRNQRHGSSGDSEARNNGMVPEAPQKRESPAPSDENDSDDETSVSSITNPTYQMPQMPHDQIRVVDQTAVGPETVNSGHKETVNYSPSTSSFRRPRPSALQHYSTPAETPPIPRAPAMSRSQEKRMHLKQFPPPATIRVNNQLSDDFPEEDIPAASNEESSPLPPTPPVQPQSKLDKFVSNQEELAAKIRAWDEMSTGGRNKSLTGQSESQDSSDLQEKQQADMALAPRYQASQSAAAGRQHPWDAEMLPPREENRPDKPNMRDTSMESAFGVELEMGQQRPEFPEESFNPSKRIPESLPSAFSPTSSPKGASAEGSNDFFNNAFQADPMSFFDEGNNSAWDIPPATARQQQARAHQISDEFDAAWVSMPSSALFPDNEEIPEEKLTIVQPEKKRDTNFDWPELSGAHSSRGRSMNRPADLNESFESTHSAPAPKIRNRQANDFRSPSVERGAIEVSLVDDTPGPSWNKVPRDFSSEQHHGHSNQHEDKAGSKAKKKGFLRAFMRREKKKEGSRPPQHASEASVGAHSLPNRPVPKVATLPLPPGVDLQEMAPPRGRRHGRNSPGARSNSLERFRSKSMAQKFNRVMRLYNDD